MISKITKNVLSFILSLVSCSVYAQEKVVGMWPFTPASTQGTYFRKILEQANKEQNEYVFQFESRLGAGGAIATKVVLDSDKPMLLAHSAGFFVRPFLFKDTPYKLEQFRPLMIMAINSNILVTKNKTIQDLMKQRTINIGTAGAGSGTHLMAETLAKYFTASDVKMVHYTNTIDAYNAVVGGHIDATFENFGDARAKGGTTMIGTTGSSKIDNYPLLRDIGFPNMSNISAIFAIYVRKDIPEKTFIELQRILLKAEKIDIVQNLYKQDISIKDSLKIDNLDKWYSETISRFESLTRGIKVD